jgi:anti-anti-sigma factor
MTMRITTHRKRPTALIEIAGRLDEDSIRELQSALSEARETGALLIVLDLRRIESIDASGLETVLAAEADSRQKRWDLAIVPPRHGEVATEFAAPEMKRLLGLLSAGQARRLISLYASGLRHHGSVPPRRVGH